MSVKSKRFLLIFIPVLIISGIVVSQSFEKDQNPEKIDGKFVTIEINNNKIKSEIARTPQQITKGLSDRKSLPKNEGMIFYLERRRIPTFWMKNMLFPIDIIWIDDGKVVYIIENAPTPSNSKIPMYTSDKPATHVLEINAGFVRENNTSLGDSVLIPFE